MDVYKIKRPLNVTYSESITCHRFRISQNPKIARLLGSNFFGGLNQKSAMISMCKIHIYIDSESFRQIH